jgi:zinc and cadmium transporter
MVWMYTLISVAAVSLLSLVGIVFLLAEPARLQRMLLVLISFAVGGLTGDAFIHLIPEAFRKLGLELSTSLLILLGLVIFFAVERLIRWRQCQHAPHTHHVHPVAALNIIGDGVHNFLDGAVIGASYLVSFPIGLTTTLAVVLHEIAQEIGDFGILVHAGFTIKRALLFNLLSALTAFLGALLALLVGPHVHVFSTAMLPITAGGFLYIAGSDLIPQIQEACESAGAVLAHFCSIILGMGLMALLVLLE